MQKRKTVEIKQLDESKKLTIVVVVFFKLQLGFSDDDQFMDKRRRQRCERGNNRGIA